MSLDFYLVETKETEVFDRNITHNLVAMAEEAGIYHPLWRPDEINAVYAREIIPFLERGLEKLKADPERFEKHNADNGWGLYEHFVPFVEDVLKGCRENPDAEIRVSR